MTENPFFSDWTTPFGLPPFDRIRPEHFPPAFDRGMAEHLADIAAVTGSAEAPSFANTIEALERAGRLLDRVSSVFYNLTSSNTNDALDEIERDYAPKMAQHQVKIALDPALFRRIDDLYRRRDSLGLSEDQMRLLERRHLGFVRSGAALPEAQKKRMAEISERLAVLHTAFGQNVVADEKEWRLVLSEADLGGLPDTLRQAAAQAARERGLEGQWVVTLSRSLIEPFLTYSTRRDLRRQAYEAWTRRGGLDGAHDNRPLIGEIVALRQEQASILGYPNFVAFKLDDSMAKDIGAVRRLLTQVWEPAKRRAARECAALASVARAEGMNEPIGPWDWRHYAEKVRKAEYELDEAEVKAYFTLDNVIAAAFDTASRLFGLSFLPRNDLPLYHPDVRAYEVRDADGAAVGLFLQDNFARPGKQSGAWMSSYRDQEDMGAPVLPIIANNNNFAKGDPTFLSFDDARTLFHEFGHGLHGLLSKVRYPLQSGTSVRRDFVEFPSQVMENWIAAPEVLRRFARHHETGAPMPDAMLEKLKAARTFNQGFATVEYTASALLDLAFHDGSAEGVADVEEYERRVLAGIGMPDEIGVRHRAVHFQHLFAGSGYAAGYYAYLWAEVLDADGFAAFEEKGDLFDPALGGLLKRIFQSGDTRDPMALYREFRGHDPAVGPLLEKRGLAEDKAA